MFPPQQPVANEPEPEPDTESVRVRAWRCTGFLLLRYTNAESELLADTPGADLAVARWLHRHGCPPALGFRILS